MTLPVLVDALLNDVPKLFSWPYASVCFCMMRRAEPDRIAQHIGAAARPELVPLFTGVNPMYLNDAIIMAIWYLTILWGRVLLLYPRCSVLSSSLLLGLLRWNFPWVVIHSASTRQRDV